MLVRVFVTKSYIAHGKIARGRTPVDYIHRTECGGKVLKTFFHSALLSLPNYSQPNPSQSAELPLWSPYQPHVANFEEQKEERLAENLEWSH